MAPPSNKTLFLLRHAESIKNIEDRFGDSRQGFCITAEGLAMTERLAAHLGKMPQRESGKLLIANSEARAHGTATIMQNELMWPLLVDEQLQPIESGLLSGLTEAEAFNLYPDIMKKKEAYRRGLLSGYELAYPNGEAVECFQDRVMRSLFTWTNLPGTEEFWVVGHQSTITAILSYFMAQKHRERFYYYFQLDFCFVSKLVLREERIGIIEFINKDFRSLK